MHLLNGRKNENEGFFLPPTGESLASLRNVSAWVMAAEFDAAAKNTFLQVADYYLVGHALAGR